MAATTAHKVSTWENRCGEINTSPAIHSFPAVPRHFSAPMKYCGVVLQKRSLAWGIEEMKSFVRHLKTSEGISGTHNCGFLFKVENKGVKFKWTEPGLSGRNQRRDLMVLNASLRTPKTQKSAGHALALLVLRHFSASVKYCGVVLKKRSLARGKSKDEVIR